MFGPQSIGLAKKLARRFASGDHTDPGACAKFNDKANARKSTAGIFAAGTLGREESTAPTFSLGVGEGLDLKNQPGLPFPEFLLWARRLREAEIEEFRKQFTTFDADDSGCIQ